MFIGRGCAYLVPGMPERVGILGGGYREGWVYQEKGWLGPGYDWLVHGTL